MGFIKLPAYRVFDYKPRTYDPELERRRDILRQYREEQGKSMGNSENKKEEYSPGNLIRNGFTQRITSKKRKISASTIRLAILIVILSAIAYIILVADLTPIIKLIYR